MFRPLAFLIITISVFNMLSTSCAQELAMQVQAQADAKKDLGPTYQNNFFATGVCMGFLGCLGGAFGGLRIGTAINNTGGGLGGYGPSDAQSFGCCGGAILLGVVVPQLFIHLRSYKPTPPPERLLGKSPGYIQAYTKAYQSKATSLSKKYSTTGMVTGNVASIGASLFLLYALVNY